MFRLGLWYPIIYSAVCPNSGYYLQYLTKDALGRIRVNFISTLDVVNEIFFLGIPVLSVTTFS